MTHVIVSHPVGEVVSLEEAKAWLRVDHSDDDVLIESLIGAAVQHAEKSTGLVFLPQTWRQPFAKFGARLRLDVRPVQYAPDADPPIVPVVSYYDIDNELQELDDSTYAVFHDSRGPYLALQAGQAWPMTASRPDAVTVTYQAGFMPEEEFPASLRQAILMMVATWYQQREQVSAGSISELPMSVGVQSLLGLHRVWHI